MENKGPGILSLVEEIENIETFKVITMIDCSEWLSENIYEFETIEELQSHVKLEYGRTLKNVINNLMKINWLQILLYFNLKKECEEKRRIYGNKNC